jgi:ribosomal protein L15
MGAHSSDRAHRMNEGGQMPLFRRIPKRGFSNADFRTEYQVVNVGTLDERFEAGAKVTHLALVGMGLIHDAERPVKILGTGELTKKLEVEATAFSASATAKIAKVGGQAFPLVPPKPPKPKRPERPGVGKQKPPPAGEAGAAEPKAEGKKEKGEKKEKKEKAPKKEKQGGQKPGKGEKS